MSRRDRRLLPWLSLGGLVLGVLLAELVLRQVYSALPSTVGLRGGGPAPRDPRTTLQVHPEERNLAVCQEPWLPPVATRSTWPGLADRAPLRLWTTGDSMTAGMGVEAHEAFASLLAEQVARETGAPVELFNLGQPGLGACGLGHMIEATLALHPPPSLVVAQLFADDLHSHQVVAVGDRAVGSPPTTGLHPLHALARHSYVANLTWLAWTLHFSHGLPRFTDAQTQAWFVDRFSALQATARDREVPLLVVLMAPTGLRACDGAPNEETCKPFAEGGARLAEWLDQAGVPFLDLRDHWEGRRPMALATEAARAVEDPRFLEIHPSPEGHRSLAEALLPAALRALDASAVAASSPAGDPALPPSAAP